MRFHALALCFLITLSAFGADDKESKPKPVPPLYMSAKTVAFVSFAADAHSASLKSEAVAYFTKWKRYRIVQDPKQAELIVLIGPMPKHISDEALDAVLNGRTASGVDLSSATPEFAVFDGNQLHQNTANSYRSLWSTPLVSDNVKLAAKKFREEVAKDSDTPAASNLSITDCYMLGKKGCR